MGNRQECHAELVGLVTLSLALLVSLCLNIILWLRQGTTICRDTNESCRSQVAEEENLSQNEGQYFHDLRHQEQQETPHNHHEQQENPIYGNISTDRRGSTEDCYETMTIQRTRNCKKLTETDLNYASLDLKMAKKRKKHRQQKGQAQGRSKLEDQPPVRLSTPVTSFLEVNADVDACLPPRDTSSMVSHSSIYLNSQQIAQEAEEMERDKRMSMDLENLGWNGVQGGSRQWDGDAECMKAQDKVNGGDTNVCIEPSEGQTIQSSSYQFIDMFNQGSTQTHYAEEECNL